MSTVKTIEYSPLEFPESQINRCEILRYMKCSASDEQIKSLIDKGIHECNGKLSYKIAYSVFELKKENEELDLGFTKVKSRDLSKALIDCDSIILFAATIGLGIDRLILKYGRISPSLALCIQAIGAERIEALCDRFSLDVKGNIVSYGKSPTPRFSAGYGDLPLELQREIFSTLACDKNIGLTLNDSLMMSPTKSVTAIIGLKCLK